MNTEAIFTLNGRLSPAFRRELQAFPWEVLVALLVAVAMLSLDVFVTVAFVVLVGAAVILVRWLRRNLNTWLLHLRVAFSWPALGYGEVEVVARVSSVWEKAVSRARLTRDEVVRRKVSVPGRGILGAVLRGGEAENRQVVTEVPSIVSVRTVPAGLELLASLPVGVSVQDVSGKAAALADDFRVQAVTVFRARPGTAGLVLRLREPLGFVAGRDFFARNPGVDDPRLALPVALGEDGRVVSVPLAHTLAVGATGSGKGSVLWAEVRALWPAWTAGLVRFYGADPKNTEFKGRGDLFDRMEYTSEGIADLVAFVRGIVRERLADPDTGRSFKPSVARPAVVLFFDELTSAPSVMGSAAWKAVAEDLRVVLAQGRSLGVYVVGAGQEATKEALALRDLFPSRTALRLATSTETAMVLGPDALDAGADPHGIAPANEANGYATAGLGWLRTETGEFRRVRFPYTTDEELDALVDLARRRAGATVPTPRPAVEDSSDSWYGEPSGYGKASGLGGDGR